MEDPIFDAIFILCSAAEEQGFVAVADGLEMVLDVYLMEKETLRAPDPMFKSARAEEMRHADQLRDWSEALNRPPPPNVLTSSSNFPLLLMNQP